MGFHTVLDLENLKDRILDFTVHFFQFSRAFRALYPVKKWKYPLTFENLWPRGCEPPLYLFLCTFSPLVSLRHPLLQLLHLELEGTRGWSHSEKHRVSRFSRILRFIKRNKTKTYSPRTTGCGKTHLITLNTYLHIEADMLNPSLSLQPQGRHLKRWM